jgi:hypothetical protein
MDFVRQRAAISNWFNQPRFRRFLEAFYSDAVIGTVLVFFSGSAVPTAIRTFLGSSF